MVYCSQYLSGVARQFCTAWIVKSWAGCRAISTGQNRKIKSTKTFKIGKERKKNKGNGLPLSSTAGFFFCFCFFTVLPGHTRKNCWLLIFYFFLLLSGWGGQMITQSLSLLYNTLNFSRTTFHIKAIGNRLPFTKWAVSNCPTWTECSPSQVDWQRFANNYPLIYKCRQVANTLWSMCSDECYSVFLCSGGLDSVGRFWDTTNRLHVVVSLNHSVGNWSQTFSQSLMFSRHRDILKMAVDCEWF